MSCGLAEEEGASSESEDDELMIRSDPEDVEASESASESSSESSSESGSGREEGPASEEVVVGEVVVGEVVEVEVVVVAVMEVVGERGGEGEGVWRVES